MCMRSIDHLWRHVLGSANDRARLREYEAREAQVADLCVSSLIQEDVLWLQIPVGYAAFMKVIESQCPTSHVKHRSRPSRFILGKHIRHVLQNHVQVTTAHELHQDVDPM